MKKITFIALLLVSFIGFSQNQGTVRGTVLDLEMQNEPLLFADVQLKGTSQKTQTNFRGNFEFTDLKDGEYQLVITYAGYETIEAMVKVEDDKVTQLNYGMSAKQLNMAALLAKNATAQVNDGNYSSQLPRK